MAAPIIDSIEGPRNPTPGTHVYRIIAHDPDAKVYRGTATSADTDGDEGSPKAFEVTVNEALTYGLTFDDPAVTVTPVPGQPGAFDVTFPG